MQQRCTLLVVNLAVLLSILTGCASGPYPITSPYFRIPAGSRIELNQPLTILPKTARVYLQHGKVVSPAEKDRYQANCWFLSWKVQETAQTIAADTFLVKGSLKSEDLVYNLSNVMFASQSLQADITADVGVGIGIGIGVGQNRGLFASDTPMATEYTTTLQIHSDRQPDIRQLACSHWDDPSSGEHLTLEKMQKALGNIATIIVVN